MTYRIRDGIREQLVDGTWVEVPWGEPEALPDRQREIARRGPKGKPRKRRRRNEYLKSGTAHVQAAKRHRPRPGG